MDNDFFKNIIDQFPTLALWIGCTAALIWLIRSFMDIRSKAHVSKLNKEVLNITITLLKTNELVGSLDNLQNIISDLEKNAKKISEIESSEKIKDVKKNLDKLLNVLPDNWKYRKTVSVDAEWLKEFSEIIDGMSVYLGNFSKDNSYLKKSTKELSKQSSSVFFAIENVLKSAKNQEEKSKDTINWIATAKGASALVIFITFLSSILLNSTMRNEIIETSRILDSTKAEKARAENKTKETLKSLEAANAARREAEIEIEKLKEDKDIKENNEIKIKLKWKKSSDLDLKVRLPNGGEVSYRNTSERRTKSLLKRDITNSPGEEEISVKNPILGEYKIEVNNYTKNGRIDYELYLFDGKKLIWKKQGIVDNEVLIYKFRK